MTNLTNQATASANERLETFLFGKEEQIDALDKKKATLEAELKKEAKEVARLEAELQKESKKLLTKLNKKAEEMEKMLNTEVKALIEEAMVANKVRGTSAMYAILVERLQAAKVDPSNKEAVVKHLTENPGLIQEMQAYAAPVIAPMAELAGDLHDGLLEAIKSTKSYTDTFMWIALQVYGGRSPEHTVYVAKVAVIFENDKAEFGAYIREQLDVNKKLRVRDTALFTADTVRLTGDLTEKAVMATAKALNKVAFQLPSKGIDKIAKRPEELSADVNIVKQGVNHPFKKESVADIAARIVDEKRMAEVKKKKSGAIAKLRKQQGK